MTSKEDESFVVAFVTNVLLALLFLALFVICRKLFPKIYQPRCDGSPLAPPPPPKSLFGWFLTTIRYSDEKLLVTHGLDAVMFIKFIKMMICITICMSLYGFIVLFAVNATGENTKTPSNEDESALHVGGLNSLTLSGVETRSTRLVAHLFAVIINSLIVYYFSFTMYRTYMHLRLRFKSTREKIENYSVMVRGVPKTIDDEALRSFFDELFPGKVVSVVRAYSTEKIDKKIEKRQDYKFELEKAYATHMISGERPTCRDKYIIGEVVDSFNWYQREFDKLTTEITNMQDKKLQRACVVFVVFNNIATAAQCSQILLDTKTTFLPEPAPEPRDLIWKNFYIDHHQFMIRKVVINLLFLALVFFWTFPVVFISGLSNLENLSKVKGFGFLVDILAWSPLITGFIQGFLPTLAYIIFFAILVKIITFMVTMSGVYTQSKVSRVVTTKYFAFKVVNTLLIYSISGSIIGVLEDFIGKEGMSFGYIIDLLANSLPKQSGFFINLIMLYSLSGHTKALWNPVFLILTYLKQRFLCKTAREYREAERPIPFKYAEAYTMHLLVFTILLTYSTLAPFIMIFGVLYYLMAFVSDKYNLIYVNFPAFEGGGKHWHDVFYRMYAGTILYQVLLVGVFSIYKFVPGAIVSGACVVMTLIFQWYTRSQFVRTCNYLPQRYAARRDEELNEESSKSDLLRVTSFPSIKMEIDVEPGNEKQFGPKLPIYEKNRMNVTNVTAHQFYFQPSLVPLDDKPEFVLAKGKKPAKIIKDEWVSTNDVQLSRMEAGETKQQGVPDLEEEERMEKEMEMMEKIKREKKGRTPAGEITESSPLAERKRYIGEEDSDDEDEGGVN